MGTMARCQWTQLPPELWERTILLLSSIVDVLNCQQISKSFNELIRTSSRIQFHIELAVASLESIGVEGSDVGLRALHALRASWRNPRLRKSISIPVSEPAMRAVFTGDLYVRARGIGIHPKWTTVDVTRLSEDTPETWSIGFPTGFTNFTPSASQDLLLLAESRTAGFRNYLQFSALSLRHGTPHPQAEKTQIKITVRDLERIYCAEIELRDDVVALLVSSPPFTPDIVLFNWKTASVIANIVPDGPQPTPHFCMPTSKYLFVVMHKASMEQSRAPVIGIYRVDSHASAQGAIVDSGEGRRGTGREVILTPPLLLTLELPRPMPAPIVWHTRIICTNVPTTTAFPIPRNITTSIPNTEISQLGSTDVQNLISFCTTPMGGLLSLHLDAEISSLHDRRRYVILASIESLITLAEKVSPSDPATARSLRWEVWGPQNTRWFENVPHISFTPQFHGYRFMHGEKILDFTPLERRREISRLSLGEIVHLDDDNTLISPATTNGGRERGLEDSSAEMASSLEQGYGIIRGRTHLVSSPTTITEADLFVDEVVSTLPYTETTFEVGDRLDTLPFQGILGCRGLVGMVTNDMLTRVDRIDIFSPDT